MKRSRFVTALLCAIAILTAPGCDPKACAVWSKVWTFVSVVVRPTMALAAPVLGVELGDQYHALERAAVAAGRVAANACDAGKLEADQLRDATQAAIDLISFYEAHKPATQDEVVRSLNARGVMNRAIDADADPVAALLHAAGHPLPPGMSTDGSELIGELARLKKRIR